MNLHLSIVQKMDMEPFDRNQPYNQLPLLPPVGEILDVAVMFHWGLASRALAALNRNLLRLKLEFAIRILEG
jgi:hypothetical protein